MNHRLRRITINPEQCGGRPCIRGMRIRVIDALDFLAAGLSREQVLEELPDVEAEGRSWRSVSETPWDLLARIPT